MIFSMTGFAGVEREIAAGVLQLELRSVNHRYLELQLKLDEQLRAFETLVRERINAKLVRGKVECRLSLVRRGVAGQQLQIDEAMLQQLAQLSAQVQQQLPQSRALSVADVLLEASDLCDDEELTRLTAHMEEVRRILEAGGTAGKRLDFLMQELNREANTLGSKSASIELTQASMALKVLIEQMREQIQNIE